jgi:signal transduction histidine kinase/DNA-binding response OmpR family regulator
VTDPATILVVEDRQTDRHFLVTLLGYQGHRVVEAADGLEALQSAETFRPQLIVSDVLMPSMDGYEFVRRLRQIKAVAQTPVIFYTATYHEREARELATRCGVVDILMKPAEPQAILAMIDHVLGRGRPDTSPAVPDERLFDNEHLRLVNAKLESKVRDLESAEQRLAAVLEFCRLLAIEHDPEILLSTLAMLSRRVTLAQHAVVALVASGGTTVERFWSAGLPESAAASTVPASPAASLLHPVFAERDAVRLTNPGGRPEALGLASNNPPIHSYLAVPIASPSRIYGWLSVRNKLGADEFSAADEEIALILGAHSGIALENARLFADLEKQTNALQSAVARKRYALAAARMGVWELGLSSDSLYLSETVPSMFELGSTSVPRTGRELLSFVHSGDRPTVEDAIGRAVRDQSELNLEFRVQLPSGNTRWLAARARVQFDEQAQPSHLLGVLIDVDERRSLESQLRQSQKLEAVGQLAGGIAHDFNNLLTAIIGYSNLVLETFEPSDPRHTDLSEIVHAGERAATLTRQLLAFSRKQVLQPVALDLNAVVTGIRQMLSRLIEEHVTLVTSLANDLRVVRADRGQIEQILMNLVVNARDAMPHGGHLSIETANVVLDESFAIRHEPVRPGPYVMLAVSDNGSGMNEETKQHLFEPFFTTKVPGKGTGLGLAMVHGIVHQSGGYIWVYSEPGVGSTFKIFLPAADVKAVAAATSPIEPSTGGHETVLLVEDEDSVRFLAHRILERAGYRVVEASNPKNAEAIFAENPTAFSLLLTDVIMPDSSGPAMFARLARQRPGLRVLYMSGYTDDSVARQGMIDPATEFLQKPFSAESLQRRVRQVLDQ